MQFATQSVTFLGHTISHEGKSLSSKHLTAIQQAPRPTTVKQLLSFIGLCSYCRTFVPNFSELSKPLTALTHSKTMSAPVLWNPEAEEAFSALKLALQTPPTLGLPDPSKPFVQTVDERNGCMTSVLLQSHGDVLRPVAYFSCKLDAVSAGMPRCLRAVAASEKALNASRDIVAYSPLTLLVPHEVNLILSEHKTSHFTLPRFLRYHTCLLGLPNVTVKRCGVLNPATLLPNETDGEPHDCVAELTLTCTPRPDLLDTPLQNPDLILFVDGSASRDSFGSSQVGYAVCTDHSTIESGSLPSHYSSQAAELVALTRACILAEGKRVTIHTDSRYAFGVIHDYGALWRHRGFLKSNGKPVLHHNLISQLLDAIVLPKAISVCKCAAHTNASDPISIGNQRADRAAKSAAQKKQHCLAKVSSTSETNDNKVCDEFSLSAMQSLATPNDHKLWKSAGCVKTPSGWVGPDDKPCLPSALFH